MTPDELRAICDGLNPGGQSKLARMLKWDSSMIRRRLSGDTKITYSDELAISQAIGSVRQARHQRRNKPQVQ